MARPKYPEILTVEREQEILDLWNARLNPPGSPSRIGDVQWKQTFLQYRQELVDELSTIPRTNKEARERLLADISSNDQLGNLHFFKLDPETNYSSDEITEIQMEMSDTTLILNEPRTLADVRSYTQELGNDILKEWEREGLVGSIQEAETFALNNLFYNYTYDSKGVARVTSNVETGENEKDVAAYAIVNAGNLELQNSPNTLTKNDKFWTAVTSGINSGYYPQQLITLLEGDINTVEDATNFLQNLEIDPQELNALYSNKGGSKGILDKLDSIGDSFVEDINKVVEDTKQAARLSGDTDGFYEELPEVLSADTGIELPRIGEKERTDQQLYNNFKQSGWNFNKSIEDNVKAMMAKNDFTNPNNNNYPQEWRENFTDKDITSSLGKWQRDLIKRIEDSEFGKKYTDAFNDPKKNPSLEMGFDIFNLVDGATGDNDSIVLTEIQDVLDAQKAIEDKKNSAEELQKQIEDEMEARAKFRADTEDVDFRESQAAKFLKQDPRYRAILEGEAGTLFLREVANSVSDFESFDDLLADDDFAQQVDYLAGRMNPDEVPPLSSQAAAEIGGIAGEPGLPGLIVRDPFPEPTDFDLESISPQLRQIAVDRPEYAQFLLEQIQLPGFNEQFRKVSAPRLDEEGYLAAIGGGAQDGTDAFELQQRKLDTAQERYDAIVESGEGYVDNKPTEELLAEAKRLEESRNRYQMETGVDPLTGERGAVGEAFMPGGFAREMARDRFTIDATTAEGFFKQQLPGFQSRFEETPFFKLEQDRIKETKNREELKRRLPLLRTGGRGRTIVTTGRR